MSVTELANDLGVGRTTLWRWIRAGLVPEPVKQGRQSILNPTAIRMARSLAEVAR